MKEFDNVFEELNRLYEELDKKPGRSLSEARAAKIVTIPDALLNTDFYDYPLILDGYDPNYDKDYEPYVQIAEVENVLLEDASGIEYKLLPNTFFIYSYVQEEEPDSSEVEYGAEETLIDFLKNNKFGKFKVKS